VSDPETTQPPPVPTVASPESPVVEEPKRFADLDLLQEEVARRLADNQKFLTNFLNDDYAEDEADGAGEGGEEDEDFEEL